MVFLAVGALDAAGYTVIGPVVPAIAALTGAGPGVMGALVATFAVGMAAGFAVAGHAVQRRRASLVLAASLALMAIGCTGFLLAESLAVFFPARLVMGLGSGGLWIGATFAVLERYPGEEYPRLSGLLGAYAVGAAAGPALGAIGGVRGPFGAYLALVLASGTAVALVGLPRERPAFSSDRSSLRSRGFWLASSGILLVSLALGTLDGPLPLHFSSHLTQSEIGGLYVGTSALVGLSAAAAGRLPPRPTLALATPVVAVGLGLAGATGTVPLWGLALVLAGLGFGAAEAGSLGVLLDAVGTERIVLAMVVWSQAWAVGYLAGPALAGGVAEALGFRAIGLVPLAAALIVLGLLVWTARELSPRGA